MGRTGAMGVAMWSALSAASAMASETGSAPATAPATAASPVRKVQALSERPVDVRRLRLLSPDARQRSYRLSDATAVGPGDDGRLRARVRGVRVWETGSDDAAFALGVSPVSGRLLGSLRIVR